MGIFGHIFWIACKKHHEFLLIDFSLSVINDYILDNQFVFTYSLLSIEKEHFHFYIVIN